MSYWAIYYWVTFGVTLVMAAHVPSKLGLWGNMIGSLLCGMLGFIIWPIALAAYIKTLQNSASSAAP